MSDRPTSDPRHESTGPRVEAERAAVSMYLFGRTLGLLSLAAFVSLHVQLDGLFGSEGVAPLAPLLSRMRFAEVPSLLVLTGASDGAMSFVVFVGELASLALLLGVVGSPR